MVSVDPVKLEALILGGPGIVGVPPEFTVIKLVSAPIVEPSIALNLIWAGDEANDAVPLPDMPEVDGGVPRSVTLVQFELKLGSGLYSLY